MNVATLTFPTDIALPEWLQACLLEYRSSSGSSSDAPLADADLICEAFNFAYSLHEGQYRASGEPYIAHPVAVAGLLRDLGGSAAMIAAGFLHDVIEDTDVTAEEIEQRFGIEVRRLVEGVTKLSKFNFSSKTERLAENFRRMFLAMAQDIRVIVVKLADRLHNMRTLEYLPDEKRRRIALETREIFAPLANRLGIGRFKWELEDLAFKYLEPEAYRAIRQLVADKRIDREARLERVAPRCRNGSINSGFAAMTLADARSICMASMKKCSGSRKALKKSMILPPFASSWKRTTNVTAPWQLYMMPSGLFRAASKTTLACPSPIDINRCIPL